MAATKTKAKGKKKAAGGRERTGVCAKGYELIKQGKTNQQVLDVLQRTFPTSNIKIGGVGWLRNKLRDDGVKGIKTNRELTAGKVTKKKAA